MEKAAFVEDFVTACRELGRVRIVLRNTLGIGEVFADLERLELSDGWIHLVQENAHLHLDVGRLHAVRFHPPGESNAARAISLCGDHGCPLLVVVLDQARGAAAIAQAARFERLGEEFGPAARLFLASDFGDRAAPSEAAGASERPMAGGATLWH